MYAEDEQISLVNRVITAFHFDKSSHMFVGFQLKDVITGYVQNVRAYDIDFSDIYTEEVEQSLIDSYATTRLVGFRTNMKCRAAHRIMQVQPIYYSVSSDICSNVLQPVDPLMLYELPGFGRECSDMELIKTTKIQQIDA